MIYGYLNNEGLIQTTLETAGEPPAGYITIDSHDKIGWRYIDGQLLPPLPPPVLPAKLTPRQFKQGLTLIGVRAAVEAAVEAADQDTKDWYRESTTFERDNAVMNSMAVALGKTPADIDNLFRLMESK